MSDPDKRNHDVIDARIPLKEAAEMQGHTVEVMMVYYARSKGKGLEMAMAV